MCGIFGVAIRDNGGLRVESLAHVVSDLFRLSESRGKEAAGVAVLTADRIQTYKVPRAASEMIRSGEYRALMHAALAAWGGGRAAAGGGAARPADQLLDAPLAIIGHSRLVTNGAQQIHRNNQPVVSTGIVGVHNGIVTNVDELWQRYPQMQRRCDVDTEVILSLLAHHESRGLSMTEAARRTFAEIEGCASIGVLFADRNCLLLATNNGSLYLCSSRTRPIHVFASERYILASLTARPHARRLLGPSDIVHVAPGEGYIVNLETLAASRFRLTGRDAEPIDIPRIPRPRPLIDREPRNGNGQAACVVNPGLRAAPAVNRPDLTAEHVRVAQSVARLQRCTRCILPETMPYIEFDAAGVCNICRAWRPMEVLGEKKLREAVEPYRRGDGRPDCVVTFSGGRDSSFGLHYVKTVLGLNPVAYTYDWGMITDLARRNQARICGKLGIEHILISADIRWKRENIRKNVSAWLRRPHLGTVPLFMAGDKQYFYYANQLRKRCGVELVVLCENTLEMTGFKTGFCGVKPVLGGRHIYSLSPLGKAKMLAFYGLQYLRNPAYLNGSLLDTASAYCCYYFIPHEYLNIYRYIRWEEGCVDQVLRDEFGWETAADTRSTWRIGDGTAAFYNYIYYMVAGFSENDTFRSNQIREGMLDRDAALRLIEQENQPRFESIKWYCDTIGIDFESTIARINAIPRLFESRA